MKIGLNIRFKTDYSFFGLMFFCIFGPMVIFLVLLFSIYSVLWIWSTGPAYTRRFNIESLVDIVQNNDWIFDKIFFVKYLTP